LIPLLLQQWKAQRAEIARQNEVNAQQEAENARQRVLIEQQKKRLERHEAALTELRRTLATRLGRSARETGARAGSK